MRKINFLLTLLALFMGGNYVNAQGWTASEPATGQFYLYNVKANAYLSNGSSWGTHSALKSDGFVLNITLNNGVYTIGTNSAYPGRYFTDNGYVDTSSPTNWIFEPVAGLTNTYKLKTEGGNYAYAAQGLYNVELGQDTNNEYGYWKLVTDDNRNNVANASLNNPVYLTHKIINPRFDDNNSGWNDGPARGGNTGGTNNNVQSYDDRNPCAEHYNKTYDTYQVLTNLQNGIYGVRVQGFYRNGGYAAAAAARDNGTEALNAIFYANEKEIPLKSILEDAGKATGGNRVNAGSFSGIPDNMSAASYSFSAGLYENVIYVEVTDGTLKIGIKKSVSVSADWTIFDNFRLEYYGNETTVTAVENASLIVDYNTAKTEAEKIDQKAIMQNSVLSDLQNVISTYGSLNTDIATAEELITATTALNNIAILAKSSISAYANAKAYLDETATILAGTNVYTTSAYNTYYAEPKAKYEAGTLTTDEANALVKTSTGWHSVNTIDDILLSAWTIGGEQCANYDKALYINTWSVEGVTDGSNFLTPFFEYWIDDAKSLGANTIQATITGLKPSTTYSFTIRARVRQTNDKTKISNGITMKVGEGNAIDISAGTIFGTGPFFIGNFSAVGETDAEGKLTCTITVAENSNVSWLSFYNAKYTEGEDLSAYIADYEFALNTATTRRDDAAFAAVTGKERADLIDAISTYGTVDNTSKTALITAKEALENASNTFVAAAAVYNAFAELNKNVAATLDVVLPTITNSTVAADLDIESYIVEEYNAAKTYAKSYTLGNWTNAPGTNKGESWDGTTGDNADTYFDEYNKADRAMTQTVTLPVGNYALIAKGRASVNGLLTLTVGEETVTFPHKSSTGRGIATDGTATFDPAATYANSNNGRGWEYRVLTFTSDGETPTTLTFNWITANSNWCGLDDIELLYNPTALDYSALQTAFNNVELPNFGFEKDEYAPYTNAENLKLISTVKGILANQDATSQNAINNYVTALQEIIWTANAEEVNAVYDGTFANASNDGAPAGWVTDHSAGLGGAYHARTFVLNPGDGNYDNLGAFNQGDDVRSALYIRFDGTNSAKTTKYTYGTANGYTMPLKTNTIYKLNAQAGGWGQSNKSFQIAIVNSADENIVAQNLNTPSTAISSKGNAIDYEMFFIVPAAGDYKLVLTNGNSSEDNAVVVSNIKLFSTDALVFADGAVPTYAPGNYPAVKIARNLAADKWATAVYPFAVSNVGKIAVLDSYDAATGQLNFSTSANSSTANVPFLMRSNAKVSEIALTNVVVEAINNNPSATANEVNFIGSYTKKDITNAEKNYVLSDNTIYPVGENAATINPYRAYFQVDQDGQEGEARALTLFIDGEVTGISELVKMNNEQQGQVYDLQGRKVEKTAKGLYIKNGKKVVVK